MAKYISILRGINVGTGRKVPMADLKKLCENMGLQNLQTYIQSGNVVFELPQPESVSELETRLQKAFTQAFGFDIPVLIRSDKEWAGSIAKNPFWNDPNADINLLHMTLLKEIPAVAKIEAILQLDFSPDQFQIVGNNVFIYCANGYGKTKITNDFFEKKLGVEASTRNWKTVMKLHEMINS